MKIYFDNCVYNRPFDAHQTQERIFIEAVAFYIALKWAEDGKIKIISSDALIYENEKTSDPDRRLRIRTYLSKAYRRVELSDSIVKRAKEIIPFGFRGIDALHIAMAEYGGADYFVTCDKAIIKKGKNYHDKLKVKIVGILEFVQEVLNVKKFERN